MLKINALILGAAIGVISNLPITGVHAASSQTNGLKVSPAISNIQVSPGQDSAIINETVTNITGTKLAVNISTKDFGALNGNGSIGFYGSSYKESNNPHSLAASIQIPNTEYFIDPHQSTTISTNINNIGQLSPGGHYSAILFTPFIAISGTTHNQVSFQPSVASLVFLTTPAGGFQSLKLGGFSMSSIGFNLPSNIYILLQNSGNTQTVPRGTLTLKDPLSNVVSQTVINSNSGLILPSTSRLFNESFNTTQNLFKLPGVYHVQFKYHVDGSSNYQVLDKKFIYVNPMIFVVLFVVIVIIKLMISRKKYRKLNPRTRKRFRRNKS